MLLNFTVENWMSFRDKTSFSMVASEEKLHDYRIPRIEEHETNVLPISAVFGGNASGKSNFFEALSFAKQLVMNGRIEPNSIDISPFKLDPKSEASETKFSFEIFATGNLYEFDFSVFQNEITKEKMSIIRSGKPERLYERTKDGKFKLNPSLKKREYVNLISSNIPRSELFLNNIMRFGQGESWPVFDWFKKSLVMVLPNNQFPIRLFENDGDLLGELNRVLPRIDCGITRIERWKFQGELQYILSPTELEYVKTIGEGESVRFHKQEILVSKEKGNLVAEKLDFVHSNIKGDDVNFKGSEESDGTLRALDLLPGFLELSSLDSPKVYFIDELDRSLHTRLVKELVSAYLENCTPDTRSQLIFTAHDVMLMNTELLRRDEMWISRRLNDGSTDMFSIGDFDDANKERIHLDYLHGFLGGLPNVMLYGFDFNSNKVVKQ